MESSTAPSDAKASSQPKSKAAFTPAAMRNEILTLALGLGCILVGVKAALLPFDHVSGPLEFVRWLLRLAVVSAADVFFLAMLTGVCWLAARATAGRVWPRRLCRVGIYCLFYASGLFGIFSLGFFYVTMQPFSVRMLSLVGGAGPMVSSVTPYLTLGMVTTLCLAPLAMLLLPRWVGRWSWLHRPAGWKTAVASLALVVGYQAVAQAYIHSAWNQPYRWERRIACNPQWEFLASCVEEGLKDEPFTAYFGVGEADMRDFTSREPAASQPQPIQLTGPRPQNVLVIFLESTAAEYLSLYGAKHDTTPNLKQLVNDGGAVVFDNFYVSAPYSCKSVVSLSASVYPRIDWKLMVNDPQNFNVPTLTQVLQQQGYRTCYAHSGFWSWMHRQLFLQPRVETLIDAETIPVQRLNSWGVTDKHMFEATLDWVDTDRERPFCLLAYTIETHHPYATPREPVKFDVPDKGFGDYLNALRAADENIAWYLQELKDRQLLDDTLVVITADHGEAFGQHNQRSHNFGIYECNVHVPLVLIHPSLKDLPQRVAAPREQIDIAPTVLELLGKQAPAAWQGRSLFRQGDDRPAYFFCVGNHVVLGLRDGDLKYLYYVDSGEEELFDLAKDPGEEHSLAAEMPDRCQDYRRRVRGWTQYQRAFLQEHGVE